MRPPARPNRYFYHPLDAILGTEAAIRILRMLIVRRAAVSPLLLAAGCSLGRGGTWKALRRLQTAGIVEPAEGRPRFPLYRVATGHALAGLLIHLFERERDLGALERAAARAARARG